MTVLRLAKLGLLSILLAGCTLPRGAGLQSEVIGTQEDTGGVTLGEDFQVVRIDRSTMSKLKNWPQTGSKGLGWISRQQQPASLAIKPGDTVHVTVWDAEENSLITAPGQKAVTMQPMKIATTGEVFLPFVGRISLNGLTPDAARAKIEEAYLATIPSAQVQLSVEPGRGNTANLVGGVANPGVYPLADRDVTILSLLALGGGVNAALTNPQVRLFRGGKAYGIALDRLYDDPSLDTTLRGGDRVIVEAESRAFLSLGSAGKQARHIFPTEEPTALDALAEVGGVNAGRADPKGILILRQYPSASLKSDGQTGPARDRVIFVLDLTSADGMFSAGEMRIMPDDLVYATESPVTSARTIMGLIGSVFGLGNQINDL